MSTSDYKGVFIFIEQVDGNIHGVSYELLGKGLDLARSLRARMTAVLLGNEVADLTGKLARFGAERIVVVDDPALDRYMTEPYTKALAAVIESYKPEILLLGATAIGRDLAPKVSARVHTGLTADCTKLEIDDTDNLSMTRPAFGGNIMATIQCTRHRPQMATVRPGVMQRITPRENPEYAVEKFDVPGLAAARNVEILDVVKRIDQRIDITDAKVLVSGGRGMGGPEHFVLLEKLACLLGGTVASSRACVDAGWLPKERQVGQTGKTVRPDLYIACGISGAVQHLAGMEESEIIVAINKDENAPIFDVADFGIVGDALKIIPILSEAIRFRRSAEEDT